jgi:hypothetical protein
VAYHFWLAMLTRYGGVMTQKTFRFTKQLLMILSGVLAIALVIYLEVTA